MRAAALSYSDEDERVGVAHFVLPLRDLDHGELRGAGAAAQDLPHLPAQRGGVSGAGTPCYRIGGLQKCRWGIDPRYRAGGAQTPPLWGQRGTDPPTTGSVCTELPYRLGGAQTPCYRIGRYRRPAVGPVGCRSPSYRAGGYRCPTIGSVSINPVIGLVRHGLSTLGLVGIETPAIGSVGHRPPYRVSVDPHDRGSPIAAE